MTKSARATPRVFVLDTSVLVHDPAALYRFQEHDVYLPMAVLEELDTAKQGVSEVARNARQVSRFLDALLSGADREDIERGLPLQTAGVGSAHGGRLRFALDLPSAAELNLPVHSNDNAILAAALGLRNAHPGSRVTLVSKDINLRIKATVLGIHAEDYYSDQVLDDLDLLYSGAGTIAPGQWDARKSVARKHGNYALEIPLQGSTWHVNQLLYVEDGSFEGIVRGIGDDTARLEPLTDYRQADTTVWGIRARNREQNFALNLLLDPNVDFVSLLGAAGTGKTLLTLAAGLSQTLDEQHYREILMTRVTVPLGEDIGFLPGTEEEKMTPWMGALMDNLEVLTQPGNGSDWGRAATQDVLHKRIKIRSLNFMRGRTFFGRYIILDEAQNLTAKQMKTLITRAGPGTKLVCLGNIAQIDTPYLTGTTSGLTYVVDRFKGWAHSGHITLLRGERSRLADYATESL